MKVELQERDWIAIMNAMSFRPYNEIQPLITKLADQLTPQKQAAQASDEVGVTQATSS